MISGSGSEMRSTLSKLDEAYMCISTIIKPTYEPFQAAQEAAKRNHEDTARL